MSYTEYFNLGNYLCVAYVYVCFRKRHIKEAAKDIQKLFYILVYNF